MPRLRTLVLALGALLVLLLAATFVVLPPVVRSVAVDRIARLTGRATALEKVEINVLTGRVALRGFRLAQRGSGDPALEVGALEVRLSLASLVTRHIRVASLTVTSPSVHVARLSATEFDFSDLLALVPPPDPRKPPTYVTLGRLTLTNGRVIARDATVTPATAWRLEDLAVDGTNISTALASAPGRLAVRAKVNGMPLVIDATEVALAKGAVTARVTAEGFDLAQARPYVPATVPVVPAAGRAFADVTLRVTRTDAGPAMALSGDARVEGVALHRGTEARPFVTLARAAVRFKDSQPLARALTLASVELDGLDATVTRDRDGRIDLLALAGGGADSPAAAPSDAAGPRPGGTPATGAPPAPGAIPGPAPRITVERFALGRATVTFRDRTVTPAATLALTNLSARVTGLTWPGSSPAAFDVATNMPGAGRLTAKGTAVLDPLAIDVVSAMRDAPIQPYQPYIPVPARLAGRFNAESRSTVAVKAGRITVVSRGRSWIDRFEIRAPGESPPPARVERLAIEGIDFAWPGHANAASFIVTKPELRIERDARGDLNLRRLFAAETPPVVKSPAAVAAPSAPAPAGAGTRADGTPAPATSRGRLPLDVDIGTFQIRDGFVRFLDQATQPAFGETVSRLAVRVDGLSSTPGRRAKVAVQAVVGGDAALDLRGEIAPLGELFVDLAGELRDFSLASVNPYAEPMTAWLVDRGKLRARVHYRIERDQLSAENEIVVENLHVARSKGDDEVQKKIGLPLGLIVALVTDSNNSVRVNVPMTGSLATWRADFGDAIWTVLKNVAVNILASPFRAIGRLFTGTGNKIERIDIEPAKFPAGSAVVDPEAERHLAQVADFLRRAPAVRLTLVPVTGAADVETLRAQALTARLQRLQQEAKLRDFAAAAAAEFKRAFPDTKPPATPEEQLAKLREREPAPEADIATLATRRLQAIRETLTKGEGITDARLAAAAGGATAGSGDGRVEFKLGD